MTEFKNNSYFRDMTKDLRVQDHDIYSQHKVKLKK